MKLVTIYYNEKYLCILWLFTREFFGEGRNSGGEKKLLNGSRYPRITKDNVDSYFLKRASGKRKRDRLSVDIFHGKGELSRIHGCIARGEEAIKSARFDSYLGKDKNSERLYFLELFSNRAVQWNNIVMFGKINVASRTFFFALEIEMWISRQPARGLNVNCFIVNIFVTRNRLFRRESNLPRDSVWFGNSDRTKWTIISTRVFCVI